MKRGFLKAASFAVKPRFVTLPLTNPRAKALAGDPILGNRWSKTVIYACFSSLIGKLPLFAAISELET
jgi:hypothetical protein